MSAAVRSDPGFEELVNGFARYVHRGRTLPRLLLRSIRSRHQREKTRLDRLYSRWSGSDLHTAGVELDLVAFQLGVVIGSGTLGRRLFRRYGEEMSRVLLETSTSGRSGDELVAGVQRSWSEFAEAMAQFDAAGKERGAFARAKASDAATTRLVDAWTRWAAARVSR